MRRSGAPCTRVSKVIAVLFPRVPRDFAYRRGVRTVLRGPYFQRWPVFWEVHIPPLPAALVIGALSSHMPAEYRHKVVVFRDRFTPDQRRG